MREMKEIKPTYRNRTYWDSVKYESVKVNNLTINEFKNILRLAHVKDPSVVETSSFYAFGYLEKPTVFVSKEDGRVYAEVDNRDSRRQALFLLKILHRRNLVEGYRRMQGHFGEEKEGWDIGNSSS